MRARTLLIDADPQGSATGWAMLMGDESPFALLTDAGPDLHRRLPELASGFEHVVIDTRQAMRPWFVVPSVIGLATTFFEWLNCKWATSLKSHLSITNDEECG
jgi:cellulose biosynthesis protein BcsQ